MNQRIFALTAVVILSSQFVYAQKAELNTEQSQIKWLGKKIGGQHEGTIRVKGGFIESKEDRIVAGNFVVDMTTITCTDLKDEGYNQKLVGHLKSDDFFGVSSIPTAVFTVTETSPFVGGKSTVTGDITIKGKTERITFPVVQKGNEYTAKIDIDRSKFDVRYGSGSFFDNLGDKAIDDVFTLDIKLVTN